MTKEVTEFLSNLPQDWQPLKNHAVKYFDSDSHIRKDGAAQIFRRPWVAPLNYGLLLFPPLNEQFVAKFSKRTGKEIPKYYENRLRQMNGCFVFDFSLFGLPNSVYTEGLLDRSQLNQFDLGSANLNWISEYEIDQNLFHFGGRAYSFDENIGYFLDSTNSINAIRQNGEILNKWADFRQFLDDELRIAEQMMLEEKPN